MRDITLRIPKLRAGTYFPEGIIERYSRADRAVAESWARGVSTRKMERIARKLGIERLSKDQVSAMCRSLDAEVGGLSSHGLGALEVPYLFLDATYVKCRGGRAARSPRPSSRRSASGPTACAACWALLEDAEADALAYLDFPAEHRRRIRTNNVQERMNREIKRRSRVVQVFPSPESTLRLVGAVCAEQDEDWSCRCYISPESMLRLADPAAPEPDESESSCRRGMMLVETAMELADTGRRAA